MPTPIIIAILIVGSIFLYWWRNYTWRKGSPYVEMTPKVIKRALTLAEVGPNDIFYDLGSGDGRVVIVAALRGAKAYGIEIDRLRVLYSRLWIKVLGLKGKAKIMHGDIFEKDFSKASVVYILLTQDENNILQKRLKKVLNKGTRVISVGYRFKGWNSTRTNLNGSIYGPIRLYKV